MYVTLWNGQIDACCLFNFNPFCATGLFVYFPKTSYKLSMRENYSYLELFWSVCSPNAGKYGPE